MRLGAGAGDVGAGINGVVEGTPVSWSDVGLGLGLRECECVSLSREGSRLRGSSSPSDEVATCCFCPRVWICVRSGVNGLTDARLSLSLSFLRSAMYADTEWSERTKNGLR